MNEELESQQHLNDLTRLKAVLNSAVDGIITIDDRGTVEAANPAAESLFGYSSAEMIGRNVNMLMPSPFKEEHDGYISNYLRTGEKKIIGIGREVMGRRKDGAVFPLYLAVSEVSFGHRRVFTGILHDLTELRRAEQHSTQLGRILESSLNEIFIFDAQTHRFLLVNRGALENLGYSASEMSRLTKADINPEFTRKQFQEVLEPLELGTESLIQFEGVHQRKDGTLYDVHVRLQMTIWEERQAFVAIILDITKLKQVQKELSRLNAELEARVDQRTDELRQAQDQLVRREKLATLGQLAGGVAHEIRNPLAVIKNSVYYLKMISEQLDDDGRGCVNEIDREVMTANRIVSELLDFTRDPPTQLEVFPLTNAITKAVQVASIPDTVQVRFDCPDVDPLVHADQGQIERILINLLRNACQAMSEGGILTVKTTVSPESAKVNVTDTGVGIPPEDLANVFEPLFTTKAKGIGLGLAVSRRYAERNGGCLTVESTICKGTTFQLLLPLNGRSA